jgi:hypothetical protein
VDIVASVSGKSGNSNCHRASASSATPAAPRADATTLSTRTIMMQLPFEINMRSREDANDKLTDSRQQPGNTSRQSGEL